MMNTHADKTKENERQSVANGVSHKQTSGESNFQFIDNRPEATAQRKLQEMANNNPQLRQLRTFQEMANSSHQAKSAIQVQVMDENYVAHLPYHFQNKEITTELTDTPKFSDTKLSELSHNHENQHTIQKIVQRKLQKVVNDSSVTQLLSAGASSVVQLKQPSEGQLAKIPGLADQIPVALNYYRERKKDIIEIVDSEYGWDMGDVKEMFFDEYETFFRKLPMIPDRAKKSQASFKRLLRQLTLWNDKLKVKLDKKLADLTDIIYDRENEEEELTENERDDLMDITPEDERYFQWYLKQNRAAKQVYRGDGRGVKVDFLNGFKFESILPGGTPDISFYGVLQHTHSSVNKNGMVSTTTDRPQAHSWAIDDHKHGVVYEMQVTNYIDVADLLAARNFKNRFAAQLEILIPGKIMAGEVRTVVLYSTAGEIDREDNG